MAKTLGHCKKCGQTFKRARISGNRKGYVKISEGKRAVRIKCRGCGREIEIPK